jgi:DNA primase
MNAFRTVKEAVPLPKYAGELTELKRSGGVLVGRCLLPDHEDKTPSFTVWPEGGSANNGTWWCFGCSRGSDIFDLHSYVEGCSQPWEAMVSLSLKYGVELPERLETWKRWQREKLAIEGLAEDIRSQVRSRRLFKLLILSAPEIQNIEDLAEKREEIRRCWEAFQDGMKKVYR